ncbi:MAG: polysaccharide deacetylase family protein [Kyrpidia sp.]|nr:polysaccharide deacetylase family protein [Kyrpidia sp.]
MRGCKEAIQKERVFPGWIMTVILAAAIAGSGAVSGKGGGMAHAEVHGSEGWTREQIERAANGLSVPPQDARIDKIWKAIPDVNGLQVDVEGTWRRIQAGERSEDGGIPWVIHQIPAKVQLKDLPPAPIYRGNPLKKQMALMVNVSWGEEHLPALLQVFDRRGVKGTFFLDGQWVYKHPGLAADIARRGHEIGTHGWGHPDLRGRPAAAIRENLGRSRNAIRQATGAVPALFAPPAGWYNDRVVREARAMGMYTILWTLDTVDWKNPPVGTIVQRVVGRAEPGALVLMHPTAKTPEALERIVSGLRAKGYELVTVAALLSPERPLVQPEAPGNKDTAGEEGGVERAGRCGELPILL